MIVCQAVASIFKSMILKCDFIISQQATREVNLGDKTSDSQVVEIILQFGIRRWNWETERNPDNRHFPNLRNVTENVLLSQYKMVYYKFCTGGAAIIFLNKSVSFYLGNYPLTLSFFICKLRR